MSKRDSRSWPKEVSLIIDDLERGVGPDLSLREVAERVGISRQTLWREQELCERLRLANARRKSECGKSRRRSSSERLAAHIAEIEELRSQVSRLVEAIVAACERLQGDGIDPLLYFSERAPDEIDPDPPIRASRRTQARR